MYRKHTGLPSSYKREGSATELLGPPEEQPHCLCRAVPSSGDRAGDACACTCMLAGCT